MMDLNTTYEIVRKTSTQQLSIFHIVAISVDFKLL